MISQAILGNLESSWFGMLSHLILEQFFILIRLHQKQGEVAAQADRKCDKLTQLALDHVLI